MVKNDYRRAFIMLRAAMPGFGGHVRLEKRALSGSMYFIVTAPEGAGPLRAALAGQKNGQYYAAPLGTLSRDRRGQLTLAAQFDPRSIDERPLEAYAWVTVAEAGEDCALALTGNVEGSREVDPIALERAVCALFGPANAPAGDSQPAADLPAPDERPAPTPSVEALSPQSPIAPVSPESDVKIYTRARNRQATAPADAEPVAPPPEAVPADTEPVAPPPEAVPANAEAVPEAVEEVAQAEVSPAPDCRTPQTAAQALGLPITRPWIAPAEPLRRLFATQAPADSPLAGGYTYVEGLLPAAGGPERCLMGVRAESGQITGIRYAVPGRYAPEPPAGLDDYAWNDAGYWVLDIGVS